MASRWANAEEDAALDAQRKKEKEEKRRRKAEKARKLEAEQQRQRKEEADDQDGQDGGGRPSKRRRLSPQPATAAAAADDAPAKLLRFETPAWSRSRSVENYDKLNDIEEGTYGWVTRATEIATGKVVALKRLKLEPGDRNGLPVTGLREIQILRDCNHRNVVDMKEVVVGDDTSRLDK